MRSCEIRDLLAECRRHTGTTFSREHPHPAFVLEPFASTLIEMSGSEDTHGLDEQPARPRGTGRYRAALGLDPTGRVYWITPELHVSEEGLVLRIGRHASCDFVLQHDKISRQHAVIRRVGTAMGGVWLVDDLGSMNGTTVNGRRVEGRTQAIADGDVVSFGSIVTMRPFFTPGIFFRVLQDHIDATT
ncbi:FHA domain-containing protein [bacterium]|nr:FHA domain-containing protein [bacterium]